MKIKYFERVTKEAYLADIMELLSLCDQEFIPPLSPPGARRFRATWALREGKGKGLWLILRISSISRRFWRLTTAG